MFFSGRRLRSEPEYSLTGNLGIGAGQSSFLSDDQKAELHKRALKGDVSCAKFDSNQKSIEPIPCDRLPSSLDSKNAYKVISTEPVLLGKQPETVGTLAPLK